MPVTIIDLITKLKSELEKHGNIAVKISGETVTSIEVVEAMECDGIDLPAYLDIVGA
ncbi:hypothetical protein [Pelobacter propionicus]|uniref:hypothetical protein n=1 Tax=Pelobacter propionicus TaxID=29543 RepID=UPI000057A5E6|nr:hypothetical protein [Pelobacter propionicus]